MRISPAKLGLAGVLLILIGATGFFAIRLALFAYTPMQALPPGTTAETVPGGEKETFMLVQKGDGPNALAKRLQDAGVVSDSRDFLWVGRITRQWKRIKAGEYRVTPTMTPMEVFQIITSGISVAHPVTVREGENMYEIAVDVESKGLAPKATLLKLFRDSRFLKAAGLKDAQAQTAEGYLFPDTYFFNRTMTAEDMVRQMIRRFNAAWTEDDARKAAALGLSLHEAVTLASMIEKETGAPQERPMISSVFHNRLRKGMRLQSDPTTIYGMWERYRGKIHKSDLSEANDYNTYYVPRLPVGPISNPGAESLKAAVNPVSSDYLFFVSHNDGTHEFTRSLEEHNRAVGKFQLDPKAREGKSWRDLNKTLNQQRDQAERIAAEPAATTGAQPRAAAPDAPSARRASPPASRPSSGPSRRSR